MQIFKNWGKIGVGVIRFLFQTNSILLSTADWGCLAGRCVSLCLQAARGGRAAGGSG